MFLVKLKNTDSNTTKLPNTHIGVSLLHCSTDAGCCIVIFVGGQMSPASQSVTTYISGLSCSPGEEEILAKGGGGLL